MKIAGIIAEYNPFHAGHAYHILQTSKSYGADAVICLMSGHFVQRGEAAIYDKWTRAQAAVTGGADLVLELPFFYAAQSAEGFAQGAVSILNALHCVSLLSFGTETHDLDSLRDIADILAEEPPAFSMEIKERLSEGVSYPAARAAALKACFPAIEPAVYSSPNNILAIEYMKALAGQNSAIKPVNIVRLGNRYADSTLSEQYSSATAVRRELLSNGMENLNDSDIPAVVRPLYSGDPLPPEAVFPYLLFCLRSMEIGQMRQIYEVSEGLEYKLQKAACQAGSYAEFIEMVKSKRYTQTRIQRILLYCLLHLTKEKAQELKAQSPYARVLAVKKERLGLLGEIKAHSSIPVVTKASEFPQTPLFDLDIKASDIYALLHKKIAPARRDFTQKFLVI